MNRGKNNKSFDEIVNDLNKKISSKLKYQKRPQTNINNPKPNVSVKSFILILIISILTMWVGMGALIVNSDSYALELVGGKLVKVVKGPKFILTCPYPFGEVLLLDSGVSEEITFGTASDVGGSYQLLSKDLTPYSLVINFNYQITDPKLFYKNYYNGSAEINNRVKNILQTVVHNYFASKTSSELNALGQAVIVTQLHKQMDNQFINLGIELKRLKIENMVLVLALKESAKNASQAISAPSLKSWSRKVVRDRGSEGDDL